MKIALLTFHDTTNFGSFLQTYGLFRALQLIHQDCEVLDYQCEAIRRKELPASKPESFYPRKLLKFLLLEPIKRKKYNNMMGDVHRLLTLSHKQYNKNNIHEVEDLYDAFLVGSDILWGLDITEGDTSYFLDFIKDKRKKFAFATSVGNPWTAKEKKLVEPLLQEFSRIAVRESEAAIWVGELTGTKPCVVCDPTMLLDVAEWRNFSRRSEEFSMYKNKKYVLTYFNTKDNRLFNEAMEYAKRHNCELWVINYGIPQHHCKNIKPTHIEDFLALLENAKAIFTASYHGMMFSLYFEKQFYFYNDNHSSRFNSVAKRLNIMQQKRMQGTPFIENEINYKFVSSEIDHWRKESLDILKGYWK